MHIQPFTDSDYQVVAAYNRRMQKIFYIIMASQMLFFIVFALIAPGRVPYWEYILPAIFILDILALIFLSKKFRTAQNDVREGLKITGNYKVASRNETESSYSITVNAEGIKSINVEKAVYDTIREGEELYFEFAKNSGYLLMMKRGNTVLFTAG
jgi:hypothetical protein